MHILSIETLSSQFVYHHHTNVTTKNMQLIFLKLLLINK